MESYNSKNSEHDQEKWLLLQEFGFGAEESKLALKISQNDME